MRVDEYLYNTFLSYSSYFVVVFFSSFFDFGLTALERRKHRIYTIHHIITYIYRSDKENEISKVARSDTSEYILLSRKQTVRSS